MTALEALTRIDASAPFFSTTADAETLFGATHAWSTGGLVVRRLRGRKTRSKSALMDEFAAALQFPFYFGENWNALADLVSDLDWMDHAGGIALVLTDAHLLLVDDEPRALATLVWILQDAASVFEQPVAEGERWDRPAQPFHVVLQIDCDDASDRSRWADARAELVPLPVVDRLA